MSLESSRLLTDGLGTKTAVGLALDRLLQPLASAVTAVKSTRAAYGALHDRMLDMESSKMLRLTRAIDMVKASLCSPDVYRQGVNPAALEVCWSCLSSVVGLPPLAGSSSEQGETSG